MSNTSYQTNFNNTITDFLEQLLLLFPNDSDILKLQSMVNVAKLANESLVINSFQNYVCTSSVLCENIKDKNVNFFLSYSFDEFTQNNQEGLLLLSKFKQSFTQYADNPEIVTKIFRWLNLLLYYALMDIKSK